MKQLCTFLLLAASFLPAAHSQSHLPDINPAPPSNSNFYYRNLGQIIDEQGHLHPEIEYYTEHTFPAVYLADDKVSFVATQAADTTIAGAQDSISRIDLQFLCTKRLKPGIQEKPTAVVPCGVLQAFEPSDDHLNYYLPQCPNGITNVPGYARVVYENAFPNIDVHFYSNATALKVYFVVKPGGNPADIDLLFSGQDSIGYLTGGSLAMYLRSWKLQFPQAIAYQIDASNNTTLLNWLPTWQHNGNGEVTVTTGSYNASQDLVIVWGGPVQHPTNNGNLEWATYYGDNSYQYCGHVTAGAHDTLYHVLGSAGYTFLSQPGAQSTQNNGALDWYVSKFDAIGHRDWATYYGGSDSEWPTDIKESYAGTSAGAIWVSGYSYSYGVPLGQAGSSFQQTANAGIPNQYCLDGLLASFDKQNGQLIYGTYFGGLGSYDKINEMSFDPVDQTLYIGGTTEFSTQFSNGCGAQTNGSFPLCSGSGSRFFQGSKSQANDMEGFIAAFQVNKTATMVSSLLWSTLFGGSGIDRLFTIRKVHNATENALYVGGMTYSTNSSGSYPSPITSHNIARFPLTNPGGNAFFQSSTGGSVSVNAFVARFDQNDQLSWCTLLGRDPGGIKSMAFNSAHQLYVLGDGFSFADAAPSSPYPNTMGKVPVYSNGTSYSYGTSSSHMLIARFNTDLSLGWSTFLPGPSDVNEDASSFTAGLGIDAKDRIFVTTALLTDPAPVFNAPGAYWQPQNASQGVGDFQKYDGYLMTFNPQEQPVWATYLGGAYPSAAYNNNVNASDMINDLALSDSSYLFLTGETYCPNSPYTQCPTGAYCDQTYNPSVDAFIARMNISHLPETPTGIASRTQGSGQGLLVYPNPSGGLFTVQYISKDPGSHTAVLTITDQTGRTVSATSLKLQPEENLFKINMGNLANGLYFLEINDRGQKSTAKFVKQ